MKVFGVKNWRALKKILITGRPRIGKTTVIKKVIAGLQRGGIEVDGFYTEEIRKNKNRVGFKIIGLRGFEGILAHVEFKTNFRVGKYFVKLDALEEYIDRINDSITDSEVIVIDEIGRMELFSGKFKEFIKKIFNEKRIVIATVGEKFVNRFNKNAELIRVTLDNRNSIHGIILDKF